jgi:hypothetical protein
MSDYASEQDLPLDFTRFLSGRLGMEPGGTLALLGDFLLEFEPSGRHHSGEAPSIFAAASSPNPS